jgi:hypothetical protein
MSLMDDGNKRLGADFIKLPIGFPCDGNGERRDVETGLSGLLRRIEGGGIRENANHDAEILSCTVYI